MALDKGHAGQWILIQGGGVSWPGYSPAGRGRANPPGCIAGGPARRLCPPGMDNPLRTRLAAFALVVGLHGFPLPGAPRRLPERPINLNTATVTELLQLPRVGPRTAERIVAWRQENGRFRRPEDLMNVKGIGEKTYQRMKAHIAAD